MRKPLEEAEAVISTAGCRSVCVLADEPSSVTYSRHDVFDNQVNAWESAQQPTANILYWLRGTGKGAGLLFVLMNLIFHLGSP